MPHAPPSKRPRRLDPDQIKHEVLRGLEAGLPLNVVARRSGSSQRQVNRWEHRDPAFAEEIAAARSLGWDSLAAECLSIADDREGDVLVDPDGTVKPNTANVLSRKLMIETRLKLLSKWDSGRYGDTKTLTLAGEITTTTTHTLDPRLMTEEGREALRQVMAHAKAQGLLPGPETIDVDYEEASGPEEDVPDA